MIIQVVTRSNLKGVQLSGTELSALSGDDLFAISSELRLRCSGEEVQNIDTNKL